MNDNKVLCITSLWAAASLALIWRWQRSTTKLQLPPGPKGLPLLGNVLDVPRGFPICQTFTSLAQKFNTDVLYLKLLTTDFVVLNSPEAVSDLFEKRSNIYSDRPLIPMIELIGSYSWNIAIMEYGTKWRNGRRLLHEFLNVKVVTRFDDYQRKHTHRLLFRLAESPDDFFDHTEFIVAALVMEMTYGLSTTNNEDQFLRAAVEALELVNKAIIPGSFLVNSMPILKYIPEWFPGAGFKTFARLAREKMDLVVHKPLDYVKESMKESGGSHNPSIAWSCFDRALDSGDQGYNEDAIRGATATIYTSAVETTVSVLHTFFLAMALNPDVVRKAQEELDRVVGADRLPDLSDRGVLPYISAIIKEVLRWGCPGPIGVPRRAREDDVYNGYFIPAGTTVVENVWATFYDESTFPMPHTFDPERYLRDGKLFRTPVDPEERMFGSGRRVCPGKHLAARTLFLNISCVLYLFNIEAPIGGKLEAKFSEEDLVRHPIRFKCRITPRSDMVSAQLMKSAWAD